MTYFQDSTIEMVRPGVLLDRTSGFLYFHPRLVVQVLMERGVDESVATDIAQRLVKLGNAE